MYCSDDRVLNDIEKPAKPWLHTGCGCGSAVEEEDECPEPTGTNVIVNTWKRSDFGVPA